MKNVNYKKVLVTHDGSRLSQRAIPHAVSIAKTYNAELIVLQVIDAVIRFIPAISMTPVALGTEEILEDLARREKKSAKTILNTIKRQLDDAGITNVVVAIEEGDARERIVQVAKKHGCDLIVMSTHGRTGLKRALLGSVAEDVVRNAPCPVLLVRAVQKGK